MAATGGPSSTSKGLESASLLDMLGTSGVVPRIPEVAETEVGQWVPGVTTEYIRSSLKNEFNLPSLEVLYLEHPVSAVRKLGIQ